MQLNSNDVERQFQQAKIRTLRHWYEDGLAETIVGTVFILLAAYFAAQSAVGAISGVASLVANLLLPALVVSGCLLSRRFIRHAKERYVYPRTGFVAYPQSGSLPKWLSGGLAGAIAGLTVALIKTAPGLETWIPAFQGIVIAIFFAWQGRAARVPRLTGLALGTALVGLLVSMGRFSTSLSGVLFFGAVGLMMLVSGRVVFRRFLRGAPPPEEL